MLNLLKSFRQNSRLATPTLINHGA